MAIKYAKEGDTDEDLVGGKYSDWLFGNDGRNKIWGHAGSDNIFGNGGNDELYGGPGNDVVRGGQGNDLIDGGPGSDILTGNSGVDRFVFRALDGGGTDTVRDFSPDDRLELSGFTAAPVISSGNFDGNSTADTLLTLSNGARIILLDVDGASLAVTSTLVTFADASALG